MRPAPFTQEDAERVQKAASELVMMAPKLVSEQPIFALAALTMAACHAALFMDVSFAQLMELVSLHYRAGAAGAAIQEMEEKFNQMFPAKMDTGKPS